MAGAIGAALLGPRSYDGRRDDAPWLGAAFSARVEPADVRRALWVFVAACLVHAVLAGLIALVVAG